MEDKFKKEKEGSKHVMKKGKVKNKDQSFFFFFSKFENVVHIWALLALSYVLFLIFPN